MATAATRGQGGRPQLLQAGLQAITQPDIREKLIFTFALLVVFRFVSNLPVPGVNPLALDRIFRDSAVLGFLNIFSGGALQNMSVAAMGVYPYITSSIVMQLMIPIVPALQALSKEGEQGRKQLNIYTHWMTVPMAFVQGSKIPTKAPAESLPVAGDRVQFDAAALADGHLHFYQTALPEQAVRFFAIKVGGKVRTCFDACEICGDIGYFESGSSAVCRNCTSPIVLSSLGKVGGCNPIPLPHTESGATIEIRVQDLRAALPRLKGR